MRKLSRRRSLSGSTAAIRAAAVWPSIISSSALGRGTSVPPSERIAMEAIGLGGQDALQGDTPTLAPVIFSAGLMRKHKP